MSEKTPNWIEDGQKWLDEHPELLADARSGRDIGRVLIHGMLYGNRTRTWAGGDVPPEVLLQTAIEYLEKLQASTDIEWIERFLSYTIDPMLSPESAEEVARDLHNYAQQPDHKLLDEINWFISKYKKIGEKR